MTKVFQLYFLLKSLEKATINEHFSGIIQPKFVIERTRVSYS